MALKHLRNPFRTARAAKSNLATQFQMWKFGRYGRQQFRGDPRYELQHVSLGFASRLRSGASDTAVLNRICAAYNKARSHPYRDAYLPAESLQQLLQTALVPSIRALLNYDTDTLGVIYRNFYRDPCSAGLLAAPGGMSRAYFGGSIRDIYRHFYLSHVLGRLDYWNQMTGGRFSIQDLAGPDVGNPFGIVIDGTLIGMGAEYAHYCAQRAAGLIDRSCTLRPVIAEIGSGFGAAAYYLVRDHRPVTFFSLDVPERIALASWYLMNAFPNLTFQLYGEIPGGTRADIVLLPISSLEDLGHGSFDASFSCSSFSSLAPAAADRAVHRLMSITQGSMLFMAKGAYSEWITETIRSEDSPFLLFDSRTSAWHSHKVAGAGVGGAAALASSALIEQTWLRKSIDSRMSSISAAEETHALQR